MSLSCGKHSDEIQRATFTVIQVQDTGNVTLTSLQSDTRHFITAKDVYA